MHIHTHTEAAHAHHTTKQIATKSKQRSCSLLFSSAALLCGGVPLSTASYFGFLLFFLFAVVCVCCALFLGGVDCVLVFCSFVSLISECASSHVYQVLRLPLKGKKKE